MIKKVNSFLFLILMMAFCTMSNATPNRAITTTADKEGSVEVRMHNRDVLLKKSRKLLTFSPLRVEEQKPRDSEKKRLERIENLRRLTIHNHAYLGSFDTNTKKISPRLNASLKQLVILLRKQIGKPYVWGGQRPEHGFDCSGLIFYIFNPLLKRNLPRTANEMYTDHSLYNIRQEELRSGDLVFFNINQRSGADHVGVYLSDGSFIEAPRSGLNVRISQLSDTFWQEHYLGARRVLTDETLL